MPELEDGGHRGQTSSFVLFGRFHSVIDSFSVPDPDALGIPVMIIESDNDPLVDPVLMSELKATYPSATVHIFTEVGHFPYLNRAEEYTRLIDEFFSNQ